MPKAHNIGPLFIQITKFPYHWGSKVVVRGWTQEIEEPFRTSEPFIVRLPNYKALVLGKWTGKKDEIEALNSALERRDVTYDDFTEEAGWTPAPDSDREEGSDNLYSRFNNLDGTVNVHSGEAHNSMAETAERI
jgi:hypothetical protein